MTDKDRILELLVSVPKGPWQMLPEGATAEQLNAFSQRTGIQLPSELSSWLSISNGPCVGRGGLFGVETRRESCDIYQILARHPSWMMKKWIPVASDGCGNYYIVPTNGEFGPRYPVVFIDSIASTESPAYIVASGLLKFIQFYLEDELRLTEWPFERDEVVRRDPDILKFTGVKLPWQ